MISKKFNKEYWRDANNISHWKHYWANKGHIYGQCLTHPESNYYFVNIPKNSSSWTKELLTKWCSWQSANYYNTTEILDKKTALVVLRDPIDRWCSGISEYINLYHKNFDVNTVNDAMLDWIFDRVAFDDHTERQIMFVEDINYENTHWFWCDQNYSTIFSDFLTSINHLDHAYVMSPPVNMTEGDPTKNTNNQFFRQIIKNPKYFDRLKEYFYVDYQLIESVKFVGKQVDNS
jgi:hypothetical protein